MLWARNLFFLGLVGGGIVALATYLFPSITPPARQHRAAPEPDAGFQKTVNRIDAELRWQWAEADLSPAPKANDLTVARRLSLALMGTIPSLQEVRQLESQPADERIAWYLNNILADRRYSDYFAERLARSYIGTEDGPFLVYRRRRFVTWLSDELLSNRPYDRLVHELITAEGLWTDHPASNFLTVTIQQDRGRPDPERLAGRVSRAFLGIRLDCAQCHDHKFGAWKQSHFRGLAAFFGQTEIGFSGLHDGKGQYMVENRKTKAKEAVAPKLPFLPELVKEQKDRREMLAQWIIHPKNPHLARVTVNRVWALMFGRPLAEPVDDLPTDEPSAEREGETDADRLPRVLQILADDFIAHGYDLQRLIRVIAASQAFRLDSAAEDELTSADEEAYGDFLFTRTAVRLLAEQRKQLLEQSWSVFPIARLRPEQVAGSVLQAASLSTIDSESHLLIRWARALREREFVQRYGDTGDDEFDSRSGTIPQRLLMMNNGWIKEKTKEDMFNASTRIAWMAPDDRHAVETVYLAVLSRRPTAEESAYFAGRLADQKRGERSQRMEDLYWTLINSTEFSWSH